MCTKSSILKYRMLSSKPNNDIIRLYEEVKQSSSSQGRIHLCILHLAPRKCLPWINIYWLCFTRWVWHSVNMFDENTCHHYRGHGAMCYYHRDSRTSGYGLLFLPNKHSFSNLKIVRHQRTTGDYYASRRQIGCYNISLRRLTNCESSASNYSNVSTLELCQR